jgi:diguanylate cyclase (GGDEF)-like protein
MQSLKNLAPVLILVFAAFYTWQSYDLIPVLVLYGFVFIPILLALLVAGLTFHFNRSTLFFYLLLVIIANLTLGLNWADGQISYALLSGFLPILLLVLTLLPERGIVSSRAIPAYVSLVMVVLFSIVVSKMAPAWSTWILLSDWLPARYFDWTPLSQTVLAASFTVFLYMLVLCFVRPSPHTSAGLGVLVMLVAQMHAGDSSSSLNVFSIAALLICLYAVTQESWRMAYLDELTGLPGRRALRERFAQLGGVYTVAMLDVDHFKKFNDTYGHDTGDSVLQMVAGKMGQVTSGLAYRYGGEEFTIIFKGRSIDETRALAENLRESIANSAFVINRGSRRKSEKRKKLKRNKSVTVTISIGLADSTTRADTPWAVLKRADKALYRAKGKGRNCVSN